MLISENQAGLIDRRVHNETFFVVEGFVNVYIAKLKSLWNSCLRIFIQEYLLKYPIFKVWEDEPKPRWWFQTCFLCSSLFGEDSQFDEHIFQRGWFNHQLENQSSPSHHHVVGCLKSRPKEIQPSGSLWRGQGCIRQDERSCPRCLAFFCRWNHKWKGIFRPNPKL